MRIYFLLLTFTISLFASSLGSISVVVLKNGVPLKNQSLSIVDVSKKGANIQATTDEDGYFLVKVKEGNYQIRLLARDNDKAQAFVRKNVTVKSGEESQIIIALKKNNNVAFIDAEAPNTQELAKKEIKKQKQKGTVLLTLTSSEDKKNVKGATIFVKGTNIEATSNAKGFVALDLPEGNQTISIIHQDFSAQTLKVNVIAKETISKFVSLTPASMELEEFIVLAPHIEGSVAASISAQKSNDTVGNVLGSEQFSKSGDSTVASALKRVSGITIVGGKYVYVRGLGDRYSTVMLNNLHVPSPEPTKRVVPLDMFPTSVVQSITIQKSYTGDLPASFGGGTVLIKSKDIPKDNDEYASLGLELLANSSTGQKGITNSDNSAAIPASVIAKGNNVGGTTYTKEVVNSRTLNPKETTINPGMKIELSAGKSYNVTDDISIGASGTFYYKNMADNNKLNSAKYNYINNFDLVLQDSQSTSNVTTFSTDTGMMINLGAHYYDDNEIKYTYFNTETISDRTYITHNDFVGAQEDEDKTYYEYVKKKLNLHQLSGSNDLKFSNTKDSYFDNLVVDWAYENATAKRDEPGSVEYRYKYDDTNGLVWDQKQNDYHYFILNDKVTNYRIDFTLPYKYHENNNYTKIGYFSYDKNRDFDGRKYTMLQGSPNLTADMDTLYSTYIDTLEFSAAFNPNDSYKASQKVTAYYLKQLYSITHDIDFVASVRQETSSQQLTDSEQTYDPLKTSDLFPSLGLTYRLDDDAMQFRLAYATSISRPDFREFSKSNYTDPITDNQIYGNPNLEATYISHLDLKYEWYMSEDELLSLAVFTKEFKNPIEKVQKRYVGQGNSYEVSYRNAQSATNYGIEFDFRKRFGFISDSLDKLLFATNIAYIQSNVVLKNDPNDSFVSTLTTKDRAMQGQAPYVANFTLGYDNTDTSTSALFLFNEIGEQIMSLGTDGNKDIYQQPFAKLDFVTKYKISPKLDGDIFGYALKFKAENLLDSEMKFTQGDKTTASTKPGRYYSLKLDINY